MIGRTDELFGLNQRIPLNEKLKLIHHTIRNRFEGAHRVAVALYEEKSELLKTYLASSGPDQLLQRYESRLDDAPTLRELMNTQKSRVVHDLSVFHSSRREHTRRILDQGYQSSYTVPLVFNNVFHGFLFFDSYQKAYFDEHRTGDLDVYVHLISCIVADEIRTIQILTAALNTANQIVHQRDPETAVHLDRMSRFSRVIAQDLVATGKHQFTDEYIELIYLFSGLHDIGKIGLPDEVLLKTTRLEPQEFDVMKTHTTKGATLINHMISNFGLEGVAHVEMLRNIAQFHHEKLDGTGYPLGLKEDQIPIEARIVAVADVFDALTTRRRYKEAKTNEEAFEILREMAPSQLDADCVESLVRNSTKLTRIQNQFAEVQENIDRN